MSLAAEAILRNASIRDRDRVVYATNSQLSPTELGEYRR